MVSNHPQAVFLPRFVPHVFNLTRSRHCTSNTISCQQCSTSTPELILLQFQTRPLLPWPNLAVFPRCLQHRTVQCPRLALSTPFPFLFPDVHNIGSFYSAPVAFAIPDVNYIGPRLSPSQHWQSLCESLRVSDADVHLGGPDLPYCYPNEAASESGCQ